MSTPQPDQLSPSPIQPTKPTFITSPRSVKQLTLFFTGSTFFALSALVTRRALVRRYVATTPRFYAPSNRPATAVNGHLEALEALSIATVNVASFTMMMAGGALWAFDISSMDDLRRQLKRKDRRGLAVDGSERTERDAEDEWAEWLGSTLARKEEKRKGKGNEEEA